MNWRNLIVAVLAITSSLASLADSGLRDSILASLAAQPQKHFSFVQEKKLAMLEKPLVTSGELLVSADRRVVWDIRQPYEMRYEISGNTIREIDANGERVIHAGGNPLAAALSEAMAAAFSGQWQGKEELATVTAEGTHANWILHVTPHSADLRKLVGNIDVHGSQQAITTVQISESNGDSTLIHLQTLQ